MAESEPHQNESVTPELEHEPNPERGQQFYAGFYDQGGWKYSFWPEFWWLRRNFVKRFGLKRGARILEVGCGTGFHTHVLTRMGFECVGVDQSQAGIDHARTQHPKCTYYCCDALKEMPVEQGSFDVVLARGFSPYHYDLSSETALRSTAHLLKYLKPGGVFVMTIVTDLSGRRKPGKIWHNQIEDYQQHFASFGAPWSVDHYRGMVICGLWAEEANADHLHEHAPDEALAVSS